MSLAAKSFSIFQRDAFLFVANFGTGIVVARVLGPEILGIWVMLSLLMSYAEAFGRTKAEAAAVYFIGQKRYSPDTVIFNLNIIAIASSAFVVMTIFVCFDLIIGWMSSRTDAEFSLEFQLMIIQIPLQFLYLNYSYLHIAEEEIGVFNKMVLLRAITYTGVAISLLMVAEIGLLSLVIATLFSTFIALMYGWKKFESKDLEPPVFSPTACVDMIRYGFHFYSANLLTQLQQSGTTLIAVTFLLPKQVTFLAQSQNMGQLLGSLIDPLTTVLFPRISKSEDEVAAEISCRAFRVATILVALGSLSLGICAHELIIFLYGAAYEPTANLLVIMLPGFFIGGAAGTLGSFFHGQGRAGLIPLVTLPAVALQLSLAYFLVDQYGLVGLAVSVSIGATIYGIALTGLFVLVTKVRLSALIPKLQDINFIFSFVVSNLKIR